MVLLPFQEDKQGDATKDSLDDLFPNEEEEDSSNGCEWASGARGGSKATEGWSGASPVLRMSTSRNRGRTGLGL